MTIFPKFSLQTVFTSVFFVPRPLPTAEPLRRAMQEIPHRSLGRMTHRELLILQPRSRCRLCGEKRLCRFVYPKIGLNKKTFTNTEHFLVNTTCIPNSCYVVYCIWGNIESSPKALANSLPSHTSFTLSIGAVAVLATAPAQAPATASCQLTPSIGAILHGAWRHGSRWVKCQCGHKAWNVWWNQSTRTWEFSQEDTVLIRFDWETV